MVPLVILPMVPFVANGTIGRANGTIGTIGRTLNDVGIGRTWNTRYLYLLIYLMILSRWGMGGVRTGLVVRASDSGSGDPGSILGRVGMLFP